MTILNKMKYSCLFILVLLTAACEKGGPGDPTSPGMTGEAPLIPGEAAEVDTGDEAFAEEFMHLVNDHRLSLGLNPLVNDEAVSAVAQKHSDNMASGTTAFGHGGFSSRCTAAKKALGGGNLCGENVAWGQKTPEALFTAWMSSSGHRANIEQSRYTHSGFGFKRSSKGSLYWTHLFLEGN